MQTYAIVEVDLLFLVDVITHCKTCLLYTSDAADE